LRCCMMLHALLPAAAACASVVHAQLAVLLGGKEVIRGALVHLLLAPLNTATLQCYWQTQRAVT
jgi:hypothetical protein